DGEAKEEEASRYAQDLLIPTDEYSAFTTEEAFTDQAIQRFAKRLGIAPGVVVGRLQHDKTIPFSWGNKLKQHFCFKGQE
ncbi:MAG: XRE family transcriptional regulator, partial [Bacteroidota bacterium]